MTSDLVVGPPTSMSSRANDSYITSKVKARFVDAQRFNPLHVKVVTEAAHEAAVVAAIAAVPASVVSGVGFDPIAVGAELRAALGR